MTTGEENGEQKHDETRPRRASRFWLLAPFTLLAIVVVAWSAGWFLIRDRVATEIDRALAREASLGRNWDCAGRDIAGFPFRIEINCASLSFASTDGMNLSLGSSRALAQVYQPRHLIVEVSGPMRGGDGTAIVDGDWSSLRGSVKELGRGTEQVSLIVLDPQVTVTGIGTVPVESASERVEIFARPSPNPSGGQRSVDLVVRAVNATAPMLDRLIGDAAPAQLELQARATNIRGLRGRAPEEIAENWRRDGGAIELALLDIAKGTARVQISGEFSLDDQRRLKGQLNPQAAGIEELVRRLVGPGQGQNVATMLQALSGPAREGSPANMRSLPQVDFRDGRVFVGPFPIPQLRLPPIF
jgi:hypothetical protein